MASTTNDVTDWLIYFYELVLNADQHTLNHIDFVIAKTKFYDIHNAPINERQQKVLSRMFDAGIDR